MLRRPSKFTLTDHSFPTGRSSDLLLARSRLRPRVAQTRYRRLQHCSTAPRVGHIAHPRPPATRTGSAVPAPAPEPPWRSDSGFTCHPSLPGAIAHRSRPTGRSEEHTSELQSLMRISYAVFCLKKKTTYYKRGPTNHIKHK